MLRKASSAAFVSAAILLACPGISAGENQPEPTPMENTADAITVESHELRDPTIPWVSGRLSIGYLWGEANELVYHPITGRKISHLIWDIEGVPMFGFGLTLTPVNWLKLNGDFRLNISDGSVVMDDYDWFVPGLPWTDWSHHEDVDTDRVRRFDINAEVTAYSTDTFKVYGIVGYKVDSYEWSGYGGSFIYSINGFRDTAGAIPDGLKGISYEQEYSTPYFGFGGNYSFGRFALSGSVIYSPLAEVDTLDFHYFRELKYTSHLDETDMLGVSLNASYRLTDNMRLEAGYHYVEYDTASGPVTIDDLSTGESEYWDGDVEGADNATSMVTLAISYTF